MLIKVRELSVKLVKSQVQKQYYKPFNAIEEVLKERSDNVLMQGNSMAKAGIADGSFLLIDKNLQVKNGDIIYCLYEGEWLVRFYEKHNGQITLYAAQPGMAALQVTEPITIKGVVIWAIKCLNNSLGV